MIPFSVASPFDLAASPAGLFYLNFEAPETLVFVNPATNQFVQWTLPYTATLPSDIAVRPSDGVVFLPGYAGAIAQFDRASGTLTRWALPVNGSSSSPGPLNVALVDETQVVLSFESPDGFVIGRLNTSTGVLDTWSAPVPPTSTIVMGVNGQVFTQPWTTPDAMQMGAFDLGSGVLTIWDLDSAPTSGMAVDGAGNVFFTQGGPDFVGLARLVPGSGRLTQWATNGSMQNQLAALNGLVFWGSDDGIAAAYDLEALDPTVAGVESTLVPTQLAAVIPKSFHLTPTQQTLTGQQAVATPTQATLSPTTAGAFSAWGVPGLPTGIASQAGVAYYVDGNGTWVGALRFDGGP